MADTYLEKRCEPRVPAQGEVILNLDLPGVPREILGELLDVSARGFRAGHQCTVLSTGQDLTFQHAGARGRARVMWNRIAEGKVESGFMLLG
jgi:hypothetical protein